MQDTWGWCTGMTQRDDMGRVVGGGFRVGNSKCLLISWLQSPSAVILEPRKLSQPVSTVSLSICQDVMGLDAMIFIIWMLSFKPAFSFSSFSFIKGLFSSSSLSAMLPHSSICCFLIHSNLCSAFGKGVCQGCILSPCLFNIYAEYIIRNTGLEEAQARIRIAGRNINNLRYASDTTLMAESKE